MPHLAHTLNRRVKCSLEPLDIYRSFNALAEAFNSLFKAELIRNKGPWRSIDDLELAVAEYIDWFNHRRLHGEIGLVPPAEYEAEHYRSHEAPAAADASDHSLH